jgi:hypothetical protein
VTPSIVSIVTSKESPAIAKQARGQTTALPVHPWSKQTGRQPCLLGRSQIICRRLSGLPVRNNFERDFLSFIEAMHAGAFNCADMHEYVFAAIVGLNKPEAFLAVEPFYSSLCHEVFPSLRDDTSRALALLV